MLSKLRLPAQLVLALIAGLAQALSISLPGSGQALWWLQIFSLSLLAVLLRDCARAWHGLLLGWVFAVAWLEGIVWWLFISMHTYGGLDAPMTVFAIFALALFLGSYYAVACALYVRLRPRRCSVLNFVFFAACWLLADLMRGRWFTGLPWGAGGYAHVQGPLQALAPWVGVYGIGFVAALLAAALAQCAPHKKPAPQQISPIPQQRRPWLGTGTAAVVLVASTALYFAQQTPGLLPWVRAYIPDSMQIRPHAQAMSIEVLQGNIPQDIKFEPGEGIALALAWYGQHLLASQAQLVIAPETAIPMLPQTLPQEYWDALLRHFGVQAAEPSASDPQADDIALFGVQAQATDTSPPSFLADAPRPTQAALFGVPLGSFVTGYTNSVVGLQPGLTRQTLYAYHKHHLVPFGEFIPPLFRWFTEMMDIPLGDFNRGGLQQASFEWMGQRLAPHICYEDLFGEELAARFVNAETAPTILVNFSNIGWFGDSVAVDQHLNIARMRALEFARPIVRATNTGATVVINHRGEVVQSLPRFTRATLLAQVQGYSGTTPYAWWVGRMGLYPLWIFGLLCVLITLWRGKK